MSILGEGSRVGVGGRVIIVFLGVVVLVVVFGFAVPQWRHDTRGRTISRWGAEYVDVLNSFGPVEPASGSRSLIRMSDLWNDTNDPSRAWSYTATATYTTETQDNHQLTPEEAYTAFRQRLLDDGWAQYGSERGGPYKTTRLFRGDWSLVIDPPEEGAPTGEVGFKLTSTNAGGILPY